MEIRVLQYFLTVAQEESVTRAAEVLHITQPTLSRQLAQLERELGVNLFRRGARKIVLTDEGLLLRRRAEEILDLADRTTHELAEQRDEVEGVVSIAAGEIGAVELLWRMCRAFREQYPRVRFELHTAASDVIRERLERGLADIGLMLEPVDMERFSYIRLPEREQWVALLPPGDPLTAKNTVTAEDLEKLPLILPERLTMQSELASWFGPRFSRLTVACTGNLKTNSAVAVREGCGCALTVGGLSAFWDENKLAVRPLSPALYVTVALAWKREQPLGRAAERFIQFASCFLSMDKAQKQGI